MRMLFSGSPSAGHLLPMMPIADAARAAGIETAVLTSPDLAPLVAPTRVLPAGPSIEDLLGETTRRTGADPAQPGPAAVELFAGVRVDLTFDDAVRQADEFGPDLVVCEEFDFVAPMVAAALGVPWVAHGISGSVPGPLMDAMRERLSREYRARSLTPVPRIAFVDPYPDVLRSADVPTASDRITIRPSVNEHGAERTSWQGVESELPLALVTVGTTVLDDAALSTLTSSVAAAGFTVVVTARADQLSGDADPRVHPVGFVPLAELLPTVDLVVTAGGTGTLLAALAYGLPMVVRPFVADQPWNAARLADLGAGIVIDDPAEAGDAARRIAENPKYREAARGAAAELESMNSAETVLQHLLGLVGRSAG
ncbi:glycosyltransferase [Umezawaea endophytica]|uniref:Glycosyltransferase n=1 Tax=Umezawaea endophytica TaxID=1654476 RepID=A0A9X2ZZF0_9PSEU|nr:glycosyltransferase [Umezawaea endophytica]MCS7475798.1 glycosyltransferase [Umezawaea endophytica]